MVFIATGSLKVCNRHYDTCSVTLAMTYKVLALPERGKGVAERYELAHFTPNS